MHIGGQPLLSRATITSSRLLTAFAFGIILTKFYEVEPETIAVFGAEFKTANLSAPIMWVIFFMSIGHLINWYGDYATFRVWNSAEVFPPGNNEWNTSTMLSNIESILKSIRRLTGTEEENEQLAELRQEVEKLRKEVKYLNNLEKFVLYGWYLVVPLGLAFIAFYTLSADIK